MKQIAILFDAIGNQQFAVAIKSDSSVTYYAQDGQAKEWSEWANSQKSEIDSSSLPVGVIWGSYKNATDLEIQHMVDTIGGSGANEEANSQIYIVQSKSFKFDSSARLDSKSRVPSVSDSPISHFNSEQFNSAITYKALAMRASIKEASAMYEIRSNYYFFNDEKSYFNSKPNSVENLAMRNRFDEAMSRSMERRIGKKVLSCFDSDMYRTKTGKVYTQTLDSAEIQFKSIGQRIGGGSRIARRAASASFDPNAWDGDGDGIVQEGTPFQRPAIPGVNDRSTGGVVDVSAASRAWQGMQRSQSDQTVSATGPRQRMEQARATRTASGLASRAQQSKVKSRRKAVPGVDKVSETDGQAWDSLDAGQRENVKKNAQIRRRQIEDRIKNRYSGWWSGFVNANSDLKDPDGNNWDIDSRIVGAALSDFGTEVGDMISEIRANDEMSDDAKEKAIFAIQQLLDDLKTLSSMERNDNYSMIEHLHPASRKALGGLSKVSKDTSKVNTGDTYVPVAPSGGKIHKSFSSSEPSTLFGKTGGEQTSGKIVRTEKGDKKLAAWVRRLSEENPERAERRARRKARIAGVGRSAAEAKPTDKAKARIRRAKRTIQAKLRGAESPADVAKRASQNLTKAKHPLKIQDSKDGSPTSATYKVTKEFVSRLALIANELGNYDTGETRRSGKSNDKHLLNLWENMEMNEKPTAVSQDVFERLIGAGWMPHSRGVGNNMGYAESYISDEDRFVPGEGGTVYGVGEYWAPPGSGHKWGYGNAQVVGFISPDARVIERKDLHSTVDLARPIHDAIRAHDAGIPDGQADKMDPSDYVTSLLQMIEKKIPEGQKIEDSDLWKSPVGQIYWQLIQMYKDSGNDSKSRRDTWAALQQINSMMNGRDKNYFGPLLGYDAVLDKGEVALVHNRGAMVVLDRPVTVEEGREVVRRGYELRTPKAA